MFCNDRSILMFSALTFEVVTSVQYRVRAFSASLGYLSASHYNCYETFIRCVRRRFSIGYSEQRPAVADIGRDEVMKRICRVLARWGLSVALLTVGACSLKHTYEVPRTTVPESADRSTAKPVTLVVVIDTGTTTLRRKQINENAKRLAASYGYDVRNVLHDVSQVPADGTAVVLAYKFREDIGRSVVGGIVSGLTLALIPGCTKIYYTVDVEERVDGKTGQNFALSDTDDYCIGWFVWDEPFAVTDKAVGTIDNLTATAYARLQGMETPAPQSKAAKAKEEESE